MDGWLSAGEKGSSEEEDLEVANHQHLSSGNGKINAYI